MCAAVTRKILAVSIILTWPINYEICASLRPVDILLCFFAGLILLKGAKANSKITSLVLSFLSIVLVSSFLDIMRDGVLNIEGYAYFYKLILPFVIFWAFSRAFESIRTNERLLLIFLSVMCALILWAYLHMLLFQLNLFPVQNIPYRASFPFTNWDGDGRRSGDAHLFSLTLSLTILIFFWFWYYRVLKIKGSHVAGVIIFGIPAMLLTGSRTGLAVTGIMFFVWGLKEAGGRRAKSRLHMKIKKKAMILILGACLILFPTLYVVIAEPLFNFLENSGDLVKRATDFDILGESQRLAKIKSGFALSLEHGLILGVGAFSVPGWYDNGLIALLVHSGVAGAFVFFLLLIIVTKKNFALSHAQDKGGLATVFAFIICAYLVGNLATEFWMVTRSVLPVAAILGIISSMLRERAQIVTARNGVSIR